MTKRHIPQFSGGGGQQAPGKEASGSCDDSSLKDLLYLSCNPSTLAAPSLLLRACRLSTWDKAAGGIRPPTGRGGTPLYVSLPRAVNAVKGSKVVAW